MVVSFTMKSFLQKNDIEMSSTHNEGKSIFAEKFIITLNNKICKYKTAISWQKNTCDSTNKMKHIDVKPSTNIYLSKE